jgi:hypothetical protein
MNNLLGSIPLEFAGGFSFTNLMAFLRAPDEKKRDPLLPR